MFVLSREKSTPANGGGSLVSPLSHSFDNPKTARCRSPFFNGFSILGLLSWSIFHSVSNLKSIDLL